MFHWKSIIYNLTDKQTKFYNKTVGPREEFIVAGLMIGYFRLGQFRVSLVQILQWLVNGEKLLLKYEETRN